MSQLPLSQGSDRSIHSTDTVLTHHGGRGSFSQPSQSQSQILGREQLQSQQPHAQTQAPTCSLHSHPSHTSHLRTPTVTQGGGGGASPNRSPPPSIAAFEENEREEEDAEHEREQEHDGEEDGDSDQLPLSNFGRGGRVGNKSGACVKKNGAAAAGGKSGAGGGGGRSTPAAAGGRSTSAGGGGRSTPVVGGKSTPAGEAHCRE